MDGSDCCLVCASELTFSGVGPCGHTEACSRCVARLRFVMQDKRCVVCQQPVPQVFFTRFMGDYTARIPLEQYPDLKVGLPCIGPWDTTPPPVDRKFAAVLGP